MTPSPLQGETTEARMLDWWLLCGCLQGAADPYSEEALAKLIANDAAAFQCALP